MALVAGALAAEAQDLIVKRDSTRVEARVEEVAPEHIRYRRFAATAGPVYVLPVAQVAYIRYSDGYCDRFDAPAPTEKKAENEVAAAAVTPAEAVTPAQVVSPAQTGTPAEPVAAAESAKPVVSANPAAVESAEVAKPAEAVAPAEPVKPTHPAAPAEPAAPAAAPAPAAESAPAAAPEPAPAPQDRYADRPYYFRPYEVGNLYDDGKLKGVIVEVTEDGRHGMIVSLEEAPGMLAWAVDKANVGELGLNDLKDGRNNMARLAEHLTATGGSWSDYPAFEWCRSLGEGWYLPSIDEVLRMAVAFNGGNTMVYNRKARTEFNKILTDNGGKKLDRMAFYFSSTETDEKQASSLDMNVTPAKIEALPKYTKWRVRAVHRF